MPDKKFTYTIKHPLGVNIVLVNINQVIHERFTLLQGTEISAEGVTIEGIMVMPVFGNTIDIIVEAVGEPNYLVTYNVKYKNKTLFDKDVEFRIENDGRSNDFKPNIQYI